MLRHGIAFRATGMVAVLNQADSNPGGFSAHFGTVAVHGVKQAPFFIIALRVRCHKGADVAESVELPDTSVVAIAKAFHPGKDAGLQQYPLWNGAEVLQPEINALFIGYRSGGNACRAVISSRGENVRCTGSWGVFMMIISGYKKASQ